MLEADRGPVLEVIVSRTNYISAHTNKKVGPHSLFTLMFGFDTHSYETHYRYESWECLPL